MKYYSTNGKAPYASLKEAVTRSLAPDGGLYVPEQIKNVPDSFTENIQDMTFQEIALEVAKTFFGDDIPETDLKGIIYDTLSFDCPIVKVSDNIWSLELYHGPTLAFKDVGARFMARMLAYFTKQETGTINVLVATSGDTGSAVANGFLGIDGIHVYVLYPKDKVSKIQESQFTTLGNNITALEIDGTFDDCQALVKKAFSDTGLNATMRLTSANSINVARFLPQSFYYFYAYAQMKRLGMADNLVISVPSGNFGNITAGLYAWQMGLPIERFIAANNANDIFYHYLRTGTYEPCQSIQTIANAMDVGNPSNFARILSLFHNSHENIIKAIDGNAYQDNSISQAISKCYKDSHYILDPHGACAWLALTDGLQNGEHGIFLETAHPAKFKDIVEDAIGTALTIPKRLEEFINGKKLSIPMTNRYEDFKKYLISQQNNAGRKE